MNRIAGIFDTKDRALKAVKRLIWSQGWRSRRLRLSGVVSRSSLSTPTIRPACALISYACSSNIALPRTWPISQLATW